MFFIFLAHQVFENLPLWKNQQRETLLIMLSNSTMLLNMNSGMRLRLGQLVLDRMLDNRVADESSMLKFIGPPEGDIESSANEVDSVEKAFGYCLIGYVMGNRPSPNAVLNFLKGWVRKSFISHLIGSAFIALLR